MQVAVHEAGPRRVAQDRQRLQREAVVDHRLARRHQHRALGVGGDEHAGLAIEAGRQHGGDPVDHHLARLDARRAREVVDEHGQAGDGVDAAAGHDVAVAPQLLAALVAGDAAHRRHGP